jgi:hypothetical protein
VSDGDPIGEAWLNALLLRLACLEAEVRNLRELIARQPPIPEPSNGFKVNTTSN